MRALIYLAERRGDGAVTLNQICDDLRVPRAFLSKILQQLCRNRMVKSHKGPSGGFVLERDPATVSILEIVEEIEGPVRVFDCFSDVGDCSQPPNSCRILAMFDRVGAQVEGVLKGVMLSDFMAAPGAAIGTHESAKAGSAAAGPCAG